MGVSEFKAKCLGVLEEVHSRRSEVVLTKRGKPFAKVVPIEVPRKKEKFFGRQKGTVIIHGDIIAPIDVEWEAMK